MLTLVEAINPNGSMLSLPLWDYTNGFIVSDVEGLDPVHVALVSTSFAQMHGRQLQASKREARNIRLRLELDANEVTNTVASLRQKLYEYFMPDATVTLRFHTSLGKIFQIQGVVESMDAPLFTREPAVDISIMCFEPDFLDNNETTISGLSTTTPPGTTVLYDGTIAVGFELTLNIDRTVSTLTFASTSPGGFDRSMEFVSPLSSGDMLTINTVSGAKGGSLLRGGTAYSILNAISPESAWMLLEPGSNKIQVRSPTAGIPFTVSYFEHYGGL